MITTPDTDLREAQVDPLTEGGFTLVELLIVIVILAILAAIVVFAVGTTTKNAVASSCASDSKSVESALSAYDAQMGSYPASLGVLITTTVSSNGSTVGPWLRQLPGTAHYNIVTDGNGNIFLDNPGTATTGTANNFDLNAAVCGNFT